MNQATVPNIEHFEWYQQRQSMKAQFADVFTLNGVTADSDDLDRIINTPAVRDVFIVGMYNLERENGEKAEYLYWKLGEMFGISSDSIRNLISRNSKHHAKTTQAAI